MLFPTSTFILADVVSGSRHALFYRQDGGRGGGTPIDGLSTWFAPSIIISIGSPPQTVLASLDLVYGLTRVAQGALNTDKSSTFRSTGNVTVMKSQTSSEEVTVSTATDHLAVGDWNVNSALLYTPETTTKESYQASLGLGWYRPEGHKSDPLWKAWKKPLFGLFLRRAAIQGPIWS
ncbi:hypothetical protein A1Q1_05952 [Trichosporon asahii var. asahii CBS 2479]|uniref:Uncharacterized protein n=1 Tax=Trichosporon asahii var. asahii (strain ATCC 90039 / CBS 2479 / JCM 2466 / KCTC 7840 / NBRC 103889/ NCYC 2677 / UAMH 7654) TaxID=1186058 RepID=J5SGI5_TRIAS|nr:hypothetical protein A1Q1_05952 [Trichosporon asahii var. asahii CBS 2479]EJT45506.1 hypothetical protein A1Q1_05952 [Trichosporon asahii var. asahii CBS 2479]